MMRTLFRALLATGLLAASGASLAADETNSGFQQIMAGNAANAETMLMKQHRMYPGDPVYMLNLAAIYAQTNRSELARAMYNDVLARPDEELDMANDHVESAHGVARLGLKRLDVARVSAR